MRYIDVFTYVCEYSVKCLYTHGLGQLQSLNWQLFYFASLFAIRCMYVHFPAYIVTLSFVILLIKACSNIESKWLTNNNVM